MTRHSGQSTIKVSLQHDKKELLVEAQAGKQNLMPFLSHCGAMEHRSALDAASHPHLSPLVGGKWLGALPEGAQALLSG